MCFSFLFLHYSFDPDDERHVDGWILASERSKLIKGCEAYSISSNLKAGGGVFNDVPNVTEIKARLDKLSKYYPLQYPVPMTPRTHDVANILLAHSGWLSSLSFQ